MPAEAKLVFVGLNSSFQVNCPSASFEDHGKRPFGHAKGPGNDGKEKLAVSSNYYLSDGPKRPAWVRRGRVGGAGLANTQWVVSRLGWR